MQIILISDRLGKVRTVALSRRHLLLTIALALSGAAALASAVYWASMRFAVEFKVPAIRELLAATEQRESERAREFMQQNLNAMAVKLGEMQAQLTRLDALGERLSAIAGVLPQEFRFSETPGLGGAHATSIPPYDLSLAEFNQRLATLSQGVENRSDMLGVLEAQLFFQAVNKKLLPTMLPVNAQFNASGFGMRIDPITGQQAMHEFFDF